MSGKRSFSVAGKNAVLATMHGKDGVIRPLVEIFLGSSVRVPDAFDTDRLGTFSRDVERIGSQLDAARAKIAAPFERDREASVGLASEGRFGPHPLLPFLALGHEILVLLDRETGLELVGDHADLSTSFGHASVVDVEAAIAFAGRIGFPDHGLIVIGTEDGRPAVNRLLRKNLNTISDLSVAVTEAIALCGVAHVETDMRAHRNPTRMRPIKRATINLIRLCRRECPKCGRPGFSVTERLPGLRCSWCNEPTDALKAEVMVCMGCGHRVEKAADAVDADPRHYNECNP